MSLMYAPHEHARSRCAGSPRPIHAPSRLLNGPARRDVGATREVTGVPTAGGCDAALALLFDQSLILVMRTDPDPDKVRTVLHGEGAVIDPDPRGPQLPDFLETQRGVRWVFFQEVEVLAGHSLDGFRQTRQAGPEASGGAMHSHFLESPFGLLLAGFPHQEIEPSSLRVGFDLLVPVLPFLF